MQRCICFVGRTSPVAVAVSLTFILLVAGCIEGETGLDSGDYWTDEGSEVSVNEPIEFTDDPSVYDGIVGEMSLEDLRSVPDDGQPVWMGFSSPYPVEGDCTPDQFHENIPEVVDEFPAEVEGVVTIHPRIFQNLTFCGSRQRYQGSYVIQDETGGIQVYKDSRVADVDVGDHIRMTVKGTMHEFGRDHIIAFETEEIVQEDVPWYYEEIDREFDEDEDMYEVRRIRGEVVMEGTNQNFGEMLIRSTEDEDVEWSASLDREMSNRGVGPEKGAVVQLTGPVVDSFGMEMMIANLGQVEVIEEPGDDSGE